MWFFWFLACCLTARPDDHGGKAIKKKVKKSSLEELRRELETLGVSTDKDMDSCKKRTKKELQKLLIRELKRLEQDRAGEETCVKTTRAEGYTLPMDIPNDVKMVLADLDEFLDREMEDLESNERTEDDVNFVMNTLLDQVDENAVLDSLRDKVDSTLGLKALKEKGEMEKTLTPEAGDWEDKAEQKVCFWCAGNKKRTYCSIPRKRCQVARICSRQQTL